jgi:hypothetical protein
MSLLDLNKKVGYYLVGEERLQLYKKPWEVKRQKENAQIVTAKETGKME